MTSFLAIRPYPEKVVRSVQLKNGDAARLRLINPDDEPLWLEMLRNCSMDTLHRRFRYMFKSTTHEMATRFCFIDYEKELAIVAEHCEGEQRKMLGVGRLIANAEHTEAEFALLVADPWQGLGLGSILIDYCLEIAQGWGLKKVTAETALDNYRMISMFQHRGFVLTPRPPDTMHVAKDLLA